ncbi:Pre-mRNA-splicing factor CWC2 [Balamuthia mandrillaris]
MKRGAEAVDQAMATFAWQQQQNPVGPPSRGGSASRSGGSASADREEAGQALVPTDSISPQGPPFLGTFNRPARKQAAEVDKWDTDATMYNIWYHRKLGDYQSTRVAGKENAAYRCVPRRDAGETKAAPDSWICLFFAKGKCIKGAECTFYHRLPDEQEEARLDLAYDVFGRERHRMDRDDMGGRGSFSRDNRTLYVGGLRRVKGADLEELIRKNFIEWGHIESLRVIYDKSIAFVRYKLRAAAEFAKEAMADQTLGYKEVLNVRWANEDPNPRAQEENARAMELKVRQAVQQTYGTPLYPDMQALSNGDAYPNTDTQYGDSSAAYASSSNASGYGGGGGWPHQQAGAQQQYTKEQWRQWYLYYYGYIPDGFEQDFVVAAEKEDQKEEANEEEEEEEEKESNEEEEAEEDKEEAEEEKEKEKEEEVAGGKQEKQKRRKLV